jgi:hypothetical protein
MIERRSIKDLLDLTKDLVVDDKDKNTLIKIVKPFWECDPTPIKTGAGKTKYGMRFPIHPETLYDLMVDAKGKVVLELAGASGVNALLIGLAGSKSVYLNDIVHEEVEKFIKHVKSFSSEEIQDKFRVVSGDCFESFKNEKYTGMFDVIYMRNFYHFFLGEKKQKLHALLSRLLKKGGKLVLTTNSSKLIPVSLENPDAYVFSSRRPMLRLATGNHGITSVAHSSIIRPNVCETLDPLDYKFHPLYSMQIVGGTRIQSRVTAAFKTFDDKSQKEISDFADCLISSGGSFSANNVIHTMSLTQDYFEYHECYTVAYSSTTLAKQFANSDFIMTKSVSTDAIGHIVASDANEKSITAICIKKCK